MDILSSDNIQVPFLELQGKSTSTQLIPRSDFEDAYNAFRVLHIRGYEPTTDTTDTGATQFQARDVQQLFESLNNQDKESWCIENKANNNQSQNSLGKSVSVDEDASARKFLDVSIKDQRGYCSFLVQHSETEMKTLLSNRLPMVHLPVANELQSTENNESTPIKVQYGPCLWFFFGKNYIDTSNSSTSTATLQGRPEHTDSVTHDGTWHYQLSGTKIWRLRPTTELMQQLKNKNNGTETRKQSSISGNKRKAADADADSSRGDTTACDNDAEKIYIEVECKQGDILLLNTRLWWHSTLIPPQETPCISYARDVYFADSTMASAKTDNSDNEYCQETTKDNDHQQQQSSMTNVDGTYAAEDVEAETVLFTEHTMPDCELHRSKTDANCQVVELEDDETGDTYMAVVSLRDIKAGEFFSILESDDDDEGGDSDCEEEVEWDEDDAREFLMEPL